MQDLAEKLRAWWHVRQGLGAWHGKSSAEVLSQAGWARSVGGANPYLTLFSRAGIRPRRSEEDVAETHIHELPAARGCTYVLPRQHFALGLKLAEGRGDAGDMATAVKFLGVSEAEIQRLGDEVVSAITERPMDPAGIKSVLGDSVRNLGVEGKKRGITTTLPLALGRLQASGRIRRVPINGRLDQQRFAYVRWTDAPQYPGTAEEAFAELARLYWQWIGPASIENFRWFSGLGAKSAREAVAHLGLVPVEPNSSLLILPDDLTTWRDFSIPDNHYSLVGALDSIMLLRRDAKSLIDDEDRHRPCYSDKGLTQMGHLMDLTANAILDRGRLVGQWEYDPESGKIVALPFGPVTPKLRAVIEAMEEMISSELGDCRSFSLDSPASRRPLLDFLKANNRA